MKRRISAGTTRCAEAKLDAHVLVHGKSLFTRRGAPALADTPRFEVG